MVIGVHPIPTHLPPPAGTAALRPVPVPRETAIPALPGGESPALQGEYLARGRASEAGSGGAGNDTGSRGRERLTFEARRVRMQPPALPEALSRYAANDGKAARSGHLVDVFA